MIRFLILVSVLSFALVGLAFYLKKPTPEYKALEVRAAQIFSFDRKKPGTLPAAEVRALAFATGFHDEAGMLRLLPRLELTLASTPITGDEIPRLGDK